MACRGRQGGTPAWSTNGVSFFSSVLGRYGSDCGPERTNAGLGARCFTRRYFGVAPSSTGLRSSSTAEITNVDTPALIVGS